MSAVVDFALPPELEAHEPPEARGLTRDGVRLLVGRRATGGVTRHAFADLPELLGPGDVLVVNTSATLAAAVRVQASDLTVHFSTELRSWGEATERGQMASAEVPGLYWLVELRRADGSGKATVPYRDAAVGQRFGLAGGGSVELVAPYSTGRLWIGLSSMDVHAYLRRHGSPIRYGYVPRPWPLAFYQTVFGRHPGSAEMPSAGRPFTDRMVTRLVTAGAVVVPVLLHAGVASPEAHERPYPERFDVPDPTARVVNSARDGGGRIIAVGTTVVRALESAAEPSGRLRAMGGVTDLVVDEARGVRVVDGLLTGFHEPRASHLDMLAAVAGRELLSACYAEATRHGFLWHEFGDVNLLLP
jgi:S-adenosylmethionine:tRNA ribosyltransferase-isomerase